MDDHANRPTFELDPTSESLVEQLTQAVVRVHTTDSLPVECDVTLSLNIQDGTPLLLPGRVAKADETEGESQPGIEVRLLNLPAETRGQLARWIATSIDNNDPPATADPNRYLEDAETELGELRQKLDALANEDQMGRTLVQRLVEEQAALQAKADAADPELAELQARRRDLEQARDAQVEQQEALRTQLAAELAAAETAAAEAEKNARDIEARGESEQHAARAEVAAAERQRDEQQRAAQRVAEEVEGRLEEERRRADKLSAELTAVEQQIERLADGEVEKTPELNLRLEREKAVLDREREHAAAAERRLSDTRATYEKLRGEHPDQQKTAAQDHVGPEAPDVAADDLPLIGELLGGPKTDTTTSRRSLTKSETALVPSKSAAVDAEPFGDVLDDLPQSDLADPRIKLTPGEDDGWWPMPTRHTLSSIKRPKNVPPPRPRRPVGEIAALAALAIVIAFLVLELVVDGGLVLGPLMRGNQPAPSVETDAPEGRTPIEGRAVNNPRE